MADITALLKALKITLPEDQTDLLKAAQEKLDAEVLADVNLQKQGVLSKNQELLDKLKAAKEKALPEGFDMEGYQDYTKNKDKIIADKLKAEEERLIATENWDKLKNTMNNEHESAMQKITREKQEEIDALRHSLDNELIENAAIKSIELEKGNQVLLMPHIKNRIKTFQDANGNYSTKVVDSAGNDYMDKKTGEPVSVAGLIAEFKANEAFAGAFPLQNRGSNATVVVDGKNYNATNNPFDKKGAGYSLTKQAQLRKTNPTLAEALSKEV